MQNKNVRLKGEYLKEILDKQVQYENMFGKTFEKVDCKQEEFSLSDSTTTYTFNNLSSLWLDSQRSQLKISSISRYINILNSYLIPQYGTRKIQTITRNEVMIFSRELLVSGGVKSQGLTPKMVNCIISVMKNIFNYAVEEKGIEIANIKDISVKQIQSPLRILSLNEQQRLSRYLCSNPTPSHLGILLCLYTGLRIGEICALKWKDICISEQYLFVHQSMQRIQTHDVNEKKTKVMILPPKSNCSIRKIPIPNEVFQLLLSSKKQDDSFFLTGSANNYIEPRSMENHFKAAAKKCNIRDINFHALRHTFATRCIELGFDIKSLSEILGHASVNITLNRYVHPSMELKQKNMNMLSSLLVSK